MNEQYPHPWSREGTDPRQSAPQQAQPQGAENQAGAPAPTTGSGAPSAATQPQPGRQHPAGPQPTATPHERPTQHGQPGPFTTWNSGPTTAFGTPQAAQPTATTVAPKTTKAKGRSRVAGVLAVALLAAGVGGGAGFAAAQLSGQPSGSASGATASTTSGQDGVQTTVVQGDPTNPDWATVAAAASRAVVAIDVTTANGEGQGSGVVIDAAGHIVTNNHVVSGASNGTVTVLLGNKSYEATLVGTDPSTDLAVIKLTDPPKDLNVMQFGDSTALKVGDPVMAIGNPLGLADTVTTGIVSALNRPVTTTAVTEQQSGPRMTRQSSPDLVVTAAIQTNAAINPGNSGGALVDTSGKLIGITSSIASLSSGQDQAGNIGIGFAIGSDQVQYVVEQLIATGTAQHPQLGITAGDVRETGQMGAVVGEVGDGSPAAKAGLRTGDLVTAVNGDPVSGSESLVALVRAGRVGEPMTLTVVRDGSEESVEVTPIAAGA